MTERPSAENDAPLLDLFAGAQGCGVGYARAGYTVTSVDIEPHDRHPEIAEFITADAFDVLADPGYLRTFAVVHASPPCQGYTTMSNRWRGAGGKADEWQRSIAPVRAALESAGVPYVIENVCGARKAMRAPLLLRGSMFGLRVDRPRLFESNVPLAAPAYGHPVHDPIGVYGDLDGRRLFTRSDGTEQRAARSLEDAREAMGIDWMDWDDLREAVPPAYTEWVGRELAFYVEATCVIPSEVGQS